MKTILGVIVGVFAVILLIILLSVLGAGLGLITIPWLQFTNKIQMNRDIATKTYNADNALYNYHWFKERSGDIITASQTIDVASISLSSFESSAGTRKDWTFEDKTEASRLRAVYQGSVTYYNGLVNEYNAKAKEVDRSIFQNDLPLFFSLK